MSVRPPCLARSALGTVVRAGVVDRLTLLEQFDGAVDALRLGGYAIRVAASASGHTAAALASIQTKRRLTKETAMKSSRKQGNHPPQLRSYAGHTIIHQAAVAKNFPCRRVCCVGTVSKCGLFYPQTAVGHRDSREVVEHSDPLPRVDERMNHVASDISSAAGDDSRVLVFYHDAKRNPCMLVVSWRLAINSAREPFFCGTEEKIGKQVTQRVGDDEF
jgi:hypothetical protein